MDDLLLYLLKSAALVSIFLLVYQLLLRNDTSFQANRHFLLGGILAAAVLPAVKFTRIVEIPMSVSGTSLPASTSIPSLSEASFQINWWEVAGGLYAVITAVLLVRFLLQLLSLLQIIRGGSLTREDTYTIIRTSREVSPFSFFRFIVLNPQLHAQDDLRTILEHEKTHASQWHSADVLLANLTTALLWFNPLSWWYRKTLVQNLEYIADRETVAAVPRNEYQHTLVKLVVANHQPVLANNFYQSLIKKRIIILNKTSKQKPSLWKFGTIVPLLFVFMFFFNVKTKAQVAHSTGEITEISAVIDSETTDEELKSLKSFFAGEDVELRYENLTRSSKGAITNIEVHFLNRKIKGEKGYFKVNDPSAIKSFAIVTKDGLTAFNDDPEKDVPEIKKNILGDIGEHPLFIIEGKQYQSKELEGKIVHLQSKPSVLTGEAAKEYGSKGKDGVIVVPAGEITSQRALFTKIKNGSAEYILISGASKPLFATFKKESSSATTTGTSEVKVRGTSIIPDAKDINASQYTLTKATYIYQDEPIFVINGKETAKDFDLDSINPEEIANINVLSGNSAEALYGTEAGKKGVVVIVTKVFAEETGTNGESSGNGVEIKENGENSYSMKFSGDKEIEFSAEESLYILNGKVLGKDFDLESIDPNTIESVNVLKGETATDKYGDKARNGVIEIRTKE